MSSLARPIGLGLAARDDIGDVVGWALQARDAITFVTSIARALELDGETGEGAFRVALGAVNPNTRHPVVLAMTGSALDEILPGRFVLGMGTGLPLRLKQMGIPYDPDTAVESVSQAIDQIRALWAGERLPSESAHTD